MIPQLWDLLDYVLNDGNPNPFPIVWSNQNAPRENKPYMMVEYTNVDTPDFDDIEAEPDGYGVVQISSWRKASVNLHFFMGPDSQQFASKSKLALARAKSVDKQVELDCAIGQRLMFAHVPALLNASQWEDRIIYSFEFFWTERIPDQVGIIEVVELEGDCSQTIAKYPCLTVWDNYGTVWDYVAIDLYQPYPLPQPAPKWFTRWDNHRISEWDDYESEWDDGFSIWDESWCIKDLIDGEPH